MSLNSLKRWSPPVLTSFLRANRDALRFQWNLHKSADREKIVAEINQGDSEWGLYYGNLVPIEPQYEGGFIGLARFPRHEREILHDARHPLPLHDGVVKKIQSQDVFEHIAYELLPPILDDIYRVLAPGGVFRLSMPDYRCSMHRIRSVFDEEGRILADTRMGGSIVYDEDNGIARPVFTDDGEAHVWFPTIELVRDLIAQSALSQCGKIEFHHYIKEDGGYILNEYPDLGMPVWRAPPTFVAREGEPISIIVDFTK
ncbi:MAG: class I SAM-dependent methyltransferase [Hyphococcus sp.]